MLFTVIYRRGPAWNTAIGFREQDGIEHPVGFLRSRHDDGRLRLGGPFLDDTGGIALFDADDAVALDRDLRTDATIASRLMTFEIHPIMVAFDTGPSASPSTTSR